MRTLRVLLAGGAAMAAVAFALRDLPLPATLWSAFLLVVVPGALVHQAAVADAALRLPRMALYADSALSLWAMAGITALVTWGSDWNAATVGVFPLPAGRTLAWAAGTTAAGLAVIALWRRFGPAETPLLLHLLPRSRRERIAFAGLSASAGVCEEIVFRGFLIAALDAATGSTAVATLLACAAFGIGHAYQSLAGAVRAGALGLLLAVPLLVTGSIVPSVYAHFLIDVVSGNRNPAS